MPTPPSARSAARSARSSASTAPRSPSSLGAPQRPLPAALAERLTSLRRSAAAAIRRVPVEYRVGAILLVIVVGGFFAAVVPLLTTGGSDPRAEVSGRVPDSLPLGAPVLLPVALDNTSGSIINHLCVVVASDPAGSVVPVSAVFQGLETVTFSGDRACGGRLSGQEVINVVLTLRGARPGGAWLSLSPADGSRGIGPVLRRHVVVGG